MSNDRRGKCTLHCSEGWSANFPYRGECHLIGFLIYHSFLVVELLSSVQLLALSDITEDKEEKLWGLVDLWVLFCFSSTPSEFWPLLGGFFLVVIQVCRVSPMHLFIDWWRDICWILWNVPFVMVSIVQVPNHAVHLDFCVCKFACQSFSL